MRLILLVLLASMACSLLCPTAWALNSVCLSDAESLLSGSDHPLMSRRLGRVTIEIKAPCLNCGDTFLAGSSNVAIMVSEILTGDFLNEVKRQLRSNGVLDRQSEERISLQVNVLKISHDSSMGAYKERKSLFTYDGTTASSITLEYIFSDGANKILRIPISSIGTSDSVDSNFRIHESMAASLKKNLRLFLLGIKAALDPAFARKAEAAMQQIAGQNESTRSLVGSFVSGLGHLGNGAVDVAVLSIKVVAENSDQITNNINYQMAQAEAGSRGSSIEEDRAKAKYLSDFNDSISRMEADPNSDLNRDKRAREQERAEAKHADSVRVAKLEAAKKVALAKADAQANTEKQRRDNAEQAEKSRRETQERERKAVEAKALEEQRQREEARQYQEKKRKEEEQRKEEAARREEERLAQQRAEEQAKTNYLARMRSGIRLAARNCYGETHVGGSRPSGKEAVSCIDVSFTAYCPGSNVGISAVAKNFTGFDVGCFGDTTKIAKPSCAPNNLKVVVDDVRACN